MTTTARTSADHGSHFYFPDGRPFYEVPYADKKRAGQMRKANIADARKVGALPSVTTILKVLHKPELVSWLIEQACLAILTSPRRPDESLDAFVHRILHDEKVQDEERDAAASRGIELHNACEAYFTGQEVSPVDMEWIGQGLKDLQRFGQYVATETILIGHGYACRIDLILEDSDFFTIVDFKTSKSLPDPTKGSYKEHRLQLGAYAAAWQRKFSEASPRLMKLIRTVNCYISTQDKGKFVTCENDKHWFEDFDVFCSCLRLWYYLNSYPRKND